MTNQCINCEEEIEDFYDLCTDCAKDAYSDNIFWITCDPLITKPVINRFRENSETILTIGDGQDEFLFEQGKTVEEEIKSFNPEKEKEYKIVHEKMNSILGEMGVSKEFDEDNYIFSKKDVKIFSDMFLKLESIEHEFKDTDGLPDLYLRFGNLFFYNAIRSDVGNFEPEFRNNIVNDLLKEAEGFYTLSIRNGEDDPTAHKNLGELLLRKGEKERSIESIRKSLELKQDKDTEKLLIIALIDSNKLDEAENIHENLREDDDYFMLKGDLNKMKGGWGRAIQLYQESRLKEVMKYIGELYLANERYEKSLNAYSKYLDAKELDHEALKGKAECLLELGDEEEALEFINKSISIDAQDDKKWTILGKIFEKQGESDKAVNAFQNALKLNSENREAKNRLEDL